MLFDHIKRLGRIRLGRTALHIRLSQLAVTYKREQYIRIARETFAESLHGYEGQFYVLANEDLFFVGRDATVAALQATINRIRSLFTEDPLVQFHEPPVDKLGFCTIYKLEKDYDALLTMVAALREQAEGKTYSLSPPTPSVVAASRPNPIQPALLARLESVLSHTDISSFVRRQTTCAFVEGQPLRPVFEEIYVSIEDLQNQATPGVDLLANRWLFQYLTQTLDRQVMTMLMRDGIGTTQPFSLNLNVATVLSPEFARFESTIAPSLRGRLVIEVNKLDVFADMGAFLFARDYMRERGFRVCLDGLTRYTLPYCNRARLGLDLIKVYWSPDSLDNLQTQNIPAIRNIVKETGQARAILCRCDTRQAIDIGKELGFVMFQGRYVEQMLRG